METSDQDHEQESGIEHHNLVQASPGNVQVNGFGKEAVAQGGDRKSLEESGDGASSLVGEEKLGKVSRARKRKVTGPPPPPPPPTHTHTHTPHTHKGLYHPMCSCYFFLVFIF